MAKKKVLDTYRFEKWGRVLDSTIVVLSFAVGKAISYFFLKNGNIATLACTCGALCVLSLLRDPCRKWMLRTFTNYFYYEQEDHK